MKSKKLILIVAALLSAVFTLTLHAQTSAFTYQGRLTDSSGPASGIYDLRFTIYDADTGGNVVAGPITNSAVAVTNGLFTTTLDFGAGVFDGSDRWLEIGVATNGSGVFTNLSPRQLITSAPYAIQAANSAMAASANSVSAANVTGTLTTAQLPTSVVTNGASGVNISGTFSGDGSGMTNVPGTMPWQSVGGTNVTAAANQAYLLTNPSLDTVTLPVDATVGDVVTVSGTGSNGWEVLAGSGQSIAGSSPDIHYWAANNNAPSTNWTSVASSADGTKLVAVGDGEFGAGRIFTSTNSGVTWSANNNAPLDPWISVASSSDGTKLVAVVSNGRIFTSTNSGISWLRNTNVLVTLWQSVASSSDGTKLVAVAYSGGIYTSINSGFTWSANNNAPSAYWTSVASSSDGTRLVAVANPGWIYTSTDSGVTWSDTNNAPAAYWEFVASSADGTKLVAVFTSGSGGGIYTSTDSGISWSRNTNAPSTYWQSVASSADGTRLVAVANPGGIYTSTNSGVTWSANNNAPSSNDWYSVASSADGTKLVAVVNGGGIWTSEPAVSGASGTTAQFQYLGNGVWQLVGEPASQIVGTLSPLQLPSNLVTNGESGVTLGGSFSGTFSGNGTFAGSVGIGVTNPATPLAILGNGAASPVGITQNQVGGPATMELTTKDTSGAQATRLLLRGGSDAANVEFYTGARGSESNTLIINGTTGDVGIGTMNPTNKLTVVGDVAATAFITTSDRNAKQDFQPVSPTEVLRKVAALPITTWQFKTDHDGWHIGPMAQDFHAAFGLGNTGKGIATVDEDGVALAAIQGLNQKVREQQTELAQKQTEITELKAQLDKIEALLNHKLNGGAR